MAADCEFARTCAFYQQQIARTPDLASQYLEPYCRGDHTACARYQIIVTFGAEYVPDDVAPDELGRVPVVIEL